MKIFVLELAVMVVLLVGLIWFLRPAIKRLRFLDELQKEIDRKKHNP